MSVSVIDFTARDGGVYASNRLRTIPFSIKGVNWFGAEGKGAVVDGLWERKMTDLLDDIARLGFNAIRLPLAADNVLDNPVVGRYSLTADADLRGMRSLDLVERLVSAARAQAQSAPQRTPAVMLASAAHEVLVLTLCCYAVGSV